MPHQIVHLTLLCSVSLPSSLFQKVGTALPPPAICSRRHHKRLNLQQSIINSKPKLPVPA